MKKSIIEGKASITVFTGKKISKELEVFYNPVMAFNRDISVLLLNALGRKKMRMADPLAGSGVRSCRFLAEMKKGAIESISINDGDATAVSLIKENLKSIRRKGVQVSTHNQDANLFLLESQGFDYIDIDPFGSPNPFLDSAIKKISRGGILAITATDTAPLCGTYPSTCLRKYWAWSEKGPVMHELGLRILIRKAQLIASQYEKALTPNFSYSRDHYFRVFFVCEKSNELSIAHLKQHGMMGKAGPMWLGLLWNQSLVEKMAKMAETCALATEKKTMGRFLETVGEESSIHAAGFYDLHHYASKLKLKVLPTRESIMQKIRKKGFPCAETHFKGEGIRSTIPEKMFMSLLS